MNDLYTAEEAAEEIGMTASVIHVWQHRGFLQPAEKRGRRNLYRLSDVFACEKFRARKNRRNQ